MRPSAGDSTARGSSGTSRGGSRKNCSMNSTSSQKGIDHQPKYQVSAAAAIRVAKTKGHPSRAMIGCGYGGLTRYFCSSSFRRSDPCNATTSSVSILRRVDKAVPLDPGHHLAQPRADLLDRQLRGHAPPAEQGGRAGVVLQHELLGVLARLDAQQRIAHALARRFVDDLRAGDVLAVLGVVRDRVVHGADAALVHQVDDQLELVQAFEVRHLGSVAGLHQGIESGLDQLDAAAAEHGLLAEQVGLGLLLEVGLDDARLAAADRPAAVGALDPAFLPFAPGSAPLAQPYRPLAPGLLRVLRVRVALRAVTDDGDLPALDERQVGILVVIDLHDFTWTE